jgi:hypothetical protein
LAEDRNGDNKELLKMLEQLSSHAQELEAEVFRKTEGETLARSMMEMTVRDLEKMEARAREVEKEKEELQRELLDPRSQNATSSLQWVRR